MTVLGILLADVLLFVLFVFQYRQELGISVNGSHDAAVQRKKLLENPPPPRAPGSRQRSPSVTGRDRRAAIL